MPVSFQKTVTIDSNLNTIGGDNFTWINVNNASWVTRADGSQTGVSDFTVAENNTGADRTSQWEVRHWNYANDNTLMASFTITQDGDGQVSVTTTSTTTQAPTTSTTSTTSTTTEEPQGPTTTSTTSTTTSTTSTTTLAVLNSILLDTVSSTTATPVSVVSDGTGLSTYSDDNTSASADQQVTYLVNMEPDADLIVGSHVYWATTLPTAIGHIAGGSAPYWATEPTVDNTFDNGGAGSGPGAGQATITFSHVDPNSGLGPQGPQGGLNSQAPATEEQAETQAGPQLGDDERYLVILHPNDGTHSCAVLVTAPTLSITTTTTTSAAPTFYWSVAGGTDGLGTNPSQLYPKHYNGSSGTSGNLSQTAGTDYVAGALFYLWAEYQDPTTGNDITTAPSGGWSQYVTTPTYINFGFAEYNSTVGMWRFEFTTDQSDSGFPTNSNNDIVANIYNSVTGSNSQYGVIIDASLSCHVAGTVMNLADGSTKLIEDLQVGDVLMSYDIAGLGHDETTSTWEEYSSQINQFSASAQTAEVMGIQSSEFGKYVNFNNGLTKVTEEHPVLVKDSGNNISFKQVLDVVIGDSFYINGAWVEITSKEVVEETITAYKIDVEELDVYLADGILWHNTVTAKVE